MTSRIPLIDHSIFGIISTAAIVRALLTWNSFSPIYGWYVPSWFSFANLQHFLLRPYSKHLSQYGTYFILFAVSYRLNSNKDGDWSFFYVCRVSWITPRLNDNVRAPIRYLLYVSRKYNLKNYYASYAVCFITHLKELRIPLRWVLRFAQTWMMQLIRMSSFYGGLCDLNLCHQLLISNR